MYVYCYMYKSLFRLCMCLMIANVFNLSVVMRKYTENLKILYVRTIVMSNHQGRGFLLDIYVCILLVYIGIYVCIENYAMTRYFEDMNVQSIY